MSARPEAKSLAVQMIRFRAGDVECCLDTAQIQSIQRWERVAPGSPENGAIGTLAVGARKIPVFAMTSWFGMRGGAVQGGPVLVLTGGGVALGAMVDRVFRPFTSHRSELRALPRAARGTRAAVLGTIRNQNSLILCLNAGKLHPSPIWQWDTGEGEPAAEPPYINPVHPDAPPKRVLCMSQGAGAGQGDLVGISYMQVIEILHELNVIPLPCMAADSAVTAIADWRGHVVPVADPRRVEGEPGSAPYSAKSRYVVARGVKTYDLIALPASQLASLSFPLRQDVECAPKSATSRYVRAEFHFDGGRLVVPDLDRILAAAPGR